MRLAIALLFVATGRWCAAYDYSSTCARPHRGGRARAPPAPAHVPPHAPSPPCDLTAHTYCTTPGTGYPWHAIRRFVRENQGLMRRMYGEERHISVLKAELENFIEYDDADRRKSSEFAEDIIKAKLMYTKKSHSRAIKDRPHFRPIQTSDKYKKFDNDTLKVKPLVNHVNNSNVNSTSNSTEITNNETMIDEKDVSYKTKLESIANIEINNLDPDVITLEAVIKQTIETNSIYPTFMGSSKSEPIRDESDYKNNTEGNTTTTTEYATNATETTDVHYDDTTTDSIREGWKPMNVDTSTLPSTLLFSEHQKVKGDKTDTKATDKKEDFHPKPTQPDTVRPSVIKLRGANACESKEEMAAPFWANSTRGEVLALLNMYPFEQYIHLETCVHERKQMYCREGCRCEQQYRLHRLLAYDPRNECRGIFADWFKFPACCVCKCYDVPLEFRARSPRILHPQYDDEVKRVIYEDVARDWYSMSYDDEDDLY